MSSKAWYAHRHVALLVALAVLSGCTSIRSDAVRGLIDRQDQKTQQAIQASKAFVDQTKARTAAYDKAVSDLNKSLLDLRKQESMLALTSSSSQVVASKTGIDARAFSYQAGLLYLTTQAGLEKAVMDQFQADFDAMNQLARKIDASWQSLQALQTQLGAYAKQSSLASADPALVSAVLQQTHTDKRDVEEVIQRSKDVNKALEKAAGFGVVQGDTTEKGRGYLQDLIQLLESAKP
jgi:seryl-tRNA synthetase